MGSHDYQFALSNLVNNAMKPRNVEPEKDLFQIDDH